MNTENFKTFDKTKTFISQDSKLSKRLCYILRYGALKEGLHVDDAGFVSIEELMELPLMKRHSEADVLAELKTSVSHRKKKRFEINSQNEKTMVRAAFARKFEKNPCHEDSKVATLFETCMQTVITNLDDYDLQDFPDEFVINTMIHRLKREKKLNNKSLRSLLVPTLEHVDLEGLYLTENTLKIVWTQCPHLRTLSLRDCGYIMTDNLMERLLKKMPTLQSLNLAHCQHLTDRTLRALTKNCPNLRHLNISMIQGISDTAVIEFIQGSSSLQHIDMYDVSVSPDNRETLASLAKEKGLKIVGKVWF